MDTTQYLDVFIDESTEHLDVLYKQLLELENNPSELTIIEEIFRAAHTLKGMSATMGYEDLANLTHKLENIFDGIRNEEISVNADMMDVLFEAVDALNEMVADVSNGGDGKKDILKIANALAAIENGEESVQENSVGIGEADQQSTRVQALDEFELSILRESAERDYFNYEITVSLREDCLLKGARTFMVFEVLEKLGEVIKSEPPVQDLEEENFDLSFTVIFVSKHDKDEIKANIDKVSEIETIEVNDFIIQQYQDNQTEQVEVEPEVKKEVKTKEKNTSTSKAPKKAGAASTKTIRVNIDRLDVLMNLFEELVVDRGRLEQISDELSNHDLQETVERMTRISGDLQNVILNMRMVPIDQVFSRFPSMMRSLSRDLNKEIIMNIVGADTELDRTVIDEIGDPLIHLLRNAVDHGLEKPAEREAAGKSKQGTIRLEAYHSGNHVFIEIEDDGKGINREAVLNKAIENGIVDEQEASQLPDQEVYELILASGFSTAEVVSDVSGRGVGLDVVKNTIESLGGNISINSEEGKGTLFSVQLPLTLSIISVMLVEIQKEKYAVPLSSIIETAIIKKEDILSARNKKVIDFRGHIVPLVFLKDLFQVPQEDEVDSEYLSIVIVKKGDKMAGLVVDSFIGQQEVVLKSLGDYLTNVFAISGATILGNGQVALIIDGNALIK